MPLGMRYASRRTECRADGELPPGRKGFLSCGAGFASRCCHEKGGPFCLSLLGRALVRAGKEGSLLLLSFWRLKGVFSTRKLAVMGLLVALTALLSCFSIYLSETFRLISFAYLPGALGSLLYGPWAGLSMGFAGDFVAYMVKPMGGYFFGYALSAMLQNLIYTLFLYKRPVSLWRVAAAQVLVVVFVSLGLGFVWQQMMTGKTAAEFFVGFRLIKNLVLFPVDTALIFLLGRLAQRLEPETRP